MKKILIIIPTYNEKNNIINLVNEIKNVLNKTNLSYKILFVDDNSKDGTIEIINKLKLEDQSINLILREKKMGIGSAYLEGFRWGLKEIKPDVFIQLDADFSHPPKDIPRLIKAIKEGNNVVIGSRYISGGKTESWTLFRNIVSKTANFISRNILKIEIKDTTSGFRALDSKAIEIAIKFDFSSKGYSYQVESLYLYNKFNLECCEVPFTFKNRVIGGSKLSILEILQFMYTICKLRLSRN